MGTRSTGIALGFTIALAVAGTSEVALAADVIIGTGDSARVHRSVARGICRQMQRTIEGLTCEVLPIEGRDAAEPLAVLSDVRNGAIEVGLLESDWQYHAFRKTGPLEFIDIPFDNLRSLFSLHAEPFTVIARRDSKIETVDDLEGKRVNIGSPGSEARAIMELVMKAKGWTQESFQFVDELSESEQFLALCHDRVQAVISTVSHPDPAIAKALELCDARIVEVSGADIDKLIADKPYFAVTAMPAGTYDGVEKPVQTFGVKLTAVSSADIDEETVYQVVGTVFDNLDDIKRLHTGLGDLLPDRMITDGLSAPLHEGAKRYYQDKSMM
jgi:hypothetical protein